MKQHEMMLFCMICAVTGLIYGFFLDLIFNTAYMAIIVLGIAGITVIATQILGIYEMVKDNNVHGNNTRRL